MGSEMTKHNESDGAVELSPQVAGIAERLGITFANPDDFSLMIAERLALAETPEELFGSDGNMGWENYERIPVRIRRIWWMPSGFADGLGFYAIVEAATVSTGEVLTLTTGATNILMQLARAAQKGWLEDETVMLKRADTATAKGYFPHRLVRAGKADG